MEIDLELPSHEVEKLDAGSNTNVKIINSADRFHVSEDVNSHASEHTIEACGSNTNERVNAGADQVGEDASAADVCKVSTFEPRNGLIFETKEAAYSFYREYARLSGFGITIKASRRSKKSGMFIDVKIACSRFGSKRESSTTVNPRLCTKTNCKAGMHMKRTHDEKWTIYNFVKEHNHEISPEDYCDSILRRNKQHDTVASQKKGLQLALDEDDVQAMLEYFICMQSESPNFFYAIDLDHEKQMRNVLWVDAKGRHDYTIFHDVILVDTFYLSSEYRVPYAPIIGVNNHCQFILLGCVLIGEQTASSFLWLLQTWHKAMGGQAPKVIITDQDKVMDEVVAEVFPETRHCYCLWHILPNLPDILSHVINKNETFVSEFGRCIYQSWNDEQFENRWWKMVEKFELHEDDWIRLLYDNRNKWVPVYIRDTFLAGMSTAERSESIASFFDQYFHKGARLKEFVKQYKTFLHERYEMEAKAEFETHNKAPTLQSQSPFEKQMSMIYTHAVFQKFQDEVLGVVSCHMRKENEDEVTIRFLVEDYEERQTFLVTWNEAAFDICCSCRSFEFRGFLCKHAIIVLQMSGISRIPSSYVLKRWTRDAQISQTVIKSPNSLHCRVKRFNELCKLAIKLGEVGSLSQEAYNIAIQALEKAHEKAVGVNDSRHSINSNTSAVNGFAGTEEENQSNSMAKSLKKKKPSKKKKVHADADDIRIGMGESCQEMVRQNQNSTIYEDLHSSSIKLLYQMM